MRPSYADAHRETAGASPRERRPASYFSALCLYRYDLGCEFLGRLKAYMKTIFPCDLGLIYPWAPLRGIAQQTPVTAQLHWIQSTGCEIRGLSGLSFCLLFSASLALRGVKHAWRAGHAPQGVALCCSNCWKLGRRGEGPIREALLLRTCQHCNCGLHPICWTKQYHLHFLGANHQHHTSLPCHLQRACIASYCSVSR